jgi:trans-aconitate methyltransferase
MQEIGLVYWHPMTYRFIERMLYGRSYRRHYEALSREIGGLNVLELCCGDCQIVDYLKGNRYNGLDINPRFVNHARRRGLNVSLQDVSVAKLPEAECILINNSLYQFYPHHGQLIRKALESAQKKLIISEPVVNLTSPKNRIISFITKRTTWVGDKSSVKRFNREEMEEIFREYHADKIEFLGRNLMGVISKSERIR